eukprot:Partr_v1_DN28470_c0_g1_i1_m41288 putative ACEtylcholinesterase
MKSLLVASFLLLAALASVVDASVQVVNTKFGPVHGVPYSGNFSTRLNKSVDIHMHWPQTYLGIPFAQPPVGSREFLEPLPWTKSWMEAYGKPELNASIYGPPCLMVQGNGKTVGDNDCLYLNVFMPPRARMDAIRRENPGRKLPVLFWIFGGAFEFGNGGSGTPDTGNPYSGSYVTSVKDVIVVTINHRVGGSGFVKTPSVRGNMGIMDQKMAFRWTVENIASFGGDPNEITSYGMSSGSYTAFLLALDPGLPPVRRVILLSAPLAIHPKPVEEALEGGHSYLKIAGCSDLSVEKELACLQSLTSKQIGHATQKSKQDWFKTLISNPLKWLPVMDEERHIVNPIDAVNLSDASVVERLKQTEFIFGVGKEEAAFFIGIAEGLGYISGGTLFILKGKETIGQFLTDWFRGPKYINTAERIWKTVQAKKSGPHRQLVSTFAQRQYIIAIYHMFNQDEGAAVRVLEAYPPQLKMKDVVQTLINMLTEYMFICPNTYLARKISTVQKNTYMYQWTHIPHYTDFVFKRSHGFQNHSVSHALDVPFVFGYYPQIPLGDERITHAYIDYFAGFASGDVNNHCTPQPLQPRQSYIIKQSDSPAADDQSKCAESDLGKWRPFGTGEEYLEIGENSETMKDRLRIDKCAFWADLLYGPNKLKHMPDMSILSDIKNNL